MDNPTPCTVDGCDRSAEIRGWCRGHYQRVQRTGHPGPPHFRRSPGEPPSPCQIAGCELPAQSRGWCAPHYQRWYDGRPLEGEIRHYPKANPAPCAIDGCEEPSASRGWCRGHYHRWHRTGDTGPAQLNRYGLQEFCGAEGCDRRHRTAGYCDLHYRRMKRGVPLNSKSFLTLPSARNPDSYANVHARLRRINGPASDFPCIECGRPASQWAYQHNDPAPMLSTTGMPYSLNLNHCYAPMCLSCHGLLDNNHDEREAIFDA